MTLKDITAKIDEFNKQILKQNGRITNEQKQIYKELLKIYNNINNNLAN